MSTRATYQINDQTFYIHHDGYPEGGAAYLFNMIKAKHQPHARGDWPMAFIRGNYNADITDSHEAHGDTEYRYTVTEYPHSLELEVYARDMGHPVGGWKLHYVGNLTNFIVKYQATGVFKNLSTVGATKSEVTS